MRIWDLSDLFAMFSMKALETGYIPDTEIFAINTKMSNMFLMPAGQGYIAIDAGADASITQNDLAEHGIDPDDVNVVLLTHVHPDHMTGLGLFKAARICVCNHEMPLLDRITLHLLPDDVKKKDLELLSDGQDLEVGGHKIHCTEVPGHTPGSMMFLIDDQYLFTGDAFKVKGGKKKEHPFSMYKKLYKNSTIIVNKALEDKPLVITSHYGYYHPWDFREP